MIGTLYQTSFGGGELEGLQGLHGDATQNF